MNDVCRDCGYVRGKVYLGQWPGGHVARMVCPHCGRYIKWVAKYDIPGDAMPEPPRAEPVPKPTTPSLFGEER